jgi:hypothetical protein
MSGEPSPPNRLIGQAISDALPMTSSTAIVPPYSARLTRRDLDSCP